MPETAQQSVTLVAGNRYELVRAGATMPTHQRAEQYAADAQPQQAGHVRAQPSAAQSTSQHSTPSKRTRLQQQQHQAADQAALYWKAL